MGRYGIQLQKPAVGKAARYIVYIRCGWLAGQVGLRYKGSQLGTR